MADVCTGFTPCFASVTTQAFWDSYGDFPVQNLCDNEPLACYQAYLNGNMCPEPDGHLVQPDCGGWQSAAILLYDCKYTGFWGNMPNSPGMDCQQLYDETGYCFDQPGTGGHHSGECQLNPGPPPPPGPLDPKKEFKPRPR